MNNILKKQKPQDVIVKDRRYLHQMPSLGMICNNRGICAEGSEKWAMTLK